MNIRINGSDRRAWFSSQTPPDAQEGELGYVLDTGQSAIRHNRTWHILPSELQILKRIETLLEENQVVYSADNPMVTHDPELAAALLELRKDRGRPLKTVPIVIPGIATGAYTAADAFGTKFQIPVPKLGIIESLTFYDVDDEGVAKDLFISPSDFTGTADHDAFAISDEDLIRGDSIVISGGDYTDFGNNRLATVTGIQLPYEAPDGVLYCQLITRGLDDIAAGKEPRLSLGIRERVVD